MTEAEKLKQALKLQTKLDMINRTEQKAKQRLAERYTAKRITVADGYPEEVRRLVDEASGPGLVIDIQEQP